MNTLLRASKTAPGFSEQFHVKHQNNPMFLDRFFGQNNPKKENYHFLTLKIDKNAVFLDTISIFDTHV